MLLASFKGLIISLNRLMDFKITRQVVQVRQRILEHSDEKMDESTPLKMNRNERRKLLTKLFKLRYPIITIEECKAYKKMQKDEKDLIKDNFKELRKISHNLGINTWQGTYCMVKLFGISIILYGISVFLK